MSTEIKNTLFRFVTMRAPELSEEKNIEKRFLYRPASMESTFDLAVKNKNSQTTKWNAMKLAATTFEAIKDVDQIKSMNAKLYDFSIWLTKNKLSYNETELSQKIAETNTKLTNANIKVLWDNLFYQVVTHESFYVKESIMQMLLADNLVKKFVPNYHDENANVVHAKIVLPKQLFIEEPASNKIVPNETGKIADADNSNEALVTDPSPEMVNMQSAIASEVEISRYESLKEKLVEVEKTHKKEHQTLYNKASSDYEELIRPTMESHAQAVEEARKSWCAIKSPTSTYDPKDPCQQPPSVLRPKLPKFEFEFRNEIDLEHLYGVLPTEDFKTLLDVYGIPYYYFFGEGYQEREGHKQEATDKTQQSKQTIYENINMEYETFVSAHSIIDRLLGENKRIVIDNTPDKRQTAVSIGGVMVPTTSVLNVVPFSYEMTLRKAYSYHANYDIIIKLPNTTWEIAPGSYYNSVSTITNTSTIPNDAITRVDNTVYLKNIYIPRYSSYSNITSFELVIPFTNGYSKKFLISNFNNGTSFKGMLVDAVVPQDNTSNNKTDKTFIPSGFGVKQLGIADYKKVEQTVQGYVEGEVAHIENIMAREYRDKTTRKLHKTDNTSTTSTETEREKLSDTTTATRFEMQSEIASVLQSATDFNAGANFNASWGSEKATGLYSLGGNVSMATHSSKEQSNREAISQAQDVTQRALERIVTKVKEERIEKIVEEFEESNKHGFDNTKGDKHVVGVYRWVDKVYKNQVINYGKRLMFEFMVPEPAKLHLLGMSENKAIGTTIVKPVDPRTFEDTQNAVIKLNLKDYRAINENTISYWGSQFNVDLKPMPQRNIAIGKSMASNDNEQNHSYSKSEVISIPDDYVTKTAIAKFSSAAPGSNSGWGKNIFITMGNYANYFSQSPIVNATQLINVDGFTKEFPISVGTTNFHVLNINFTVNCELTNEAYSKWQQETFKAIIKGYQDAMTEYNQKISDENTKASNIKGENPGFYRQIENTVLRKNCISYIIDQNPNAKRTYGKDMSNGNKKFGNYEITVNEALDDYAAFAKFIEQAFEWDIMSYNFYPYYWGDRKDWAQLYQYDNNDPLFRNFMQSGMARVIVTVRPGYEEAVNYYMQTGQIWNGGEVPVIEDKLFLSIVDELRQPAGKKEGKAWATRMPTPLTILQAESIGLKVDKALPYNNDLSDFENPNEVPKSNSFQITGAQMGANNKAKFITFTYQGMHSNMFKTIQDLDDSAFPYKYVCLNQEFIINRDAKWKVTDSTVLFFEKLASQLSLIPGLEVQQFTSATGDPSGLQFTVDTSMITNFNFAKQNGFIDPTVDLVNLYITPEAVRVTNPTWYTDRILDAKGKQLSEAEANTLLPIDRFTV